MKTIVRASNGTSLIAFPYQPHLIQLNDFNTFVQACIKALKESTAKSQGARD